jgi:hypothetical protein
VYTAFPDLLSGNVMCQDLHAVVEDYPDCRTEFCEWFKRKVDEDAQFVDMTVWSEATFRLRGIVN